MTAGPTPLPPAVSQVMAEPMLYHRAPAFVEVYARALERLKAVFGTANEVQVFASSGSGAMESAVANLVRPGEPALVASCGKFGERWAELCDAYGAETVHWETEWGRKVDPAELDRRLAEHEGVELVFTTLSETSTGVVNDVRELTEVAHRHGALIAVDAVSAIGAVPLPQDEWGVDVVVSGSQKALMAPPGPRLRERQRGRARARRRRAGPALLLRLGAHGRRPAQGPARQPVHARRRPDPALDVALGLIEEEGLERGLRAPPAARPRHARGGAGARARPARRRRRHANVVTAIALPESIDGAKVPKLMRDRFGITIAGGQGHLKGKIARIAHCGYFGAFDVVVTIAAFEMTLRELGHELELGAGVAAAQRVFLEAGVPVSPPA